MSIRLFFFTRCANRKISGIRLETGKVAGCSALSLTSCVRTQDHTLFVHSFATAFILLNPALSRDATRRILIFTYLLNA